MDDREVLLEFEQDKNTEFKWIKPWSKEWFLEKTERKKYLSVEYLEQVHKRWILEFLYFHWEEINIKQDKNIDKLSNILWFQIGIKNYIYMKNDFERLKEEKLDIKQIVNKIEWLNKRNLELIWWYLEEIWISYYYFVKDLLLLDKKINVKTIIKLLKNRIYPTKTIIDFLEKNNFDIQKLLEVKQNYKINGWFDKQNLLHIDLEYIDFRYLIDKATKKEKQYWKWYLEYKQLLSWNYDENLDEEKHYMQAWKESYFSYKFIQEVLKENNQINVFPNFSYWKVLVAWFEKDIQKNSKINYKKVRIWSTECHWKMIYLKKDLFSKEDIKNLFKWDSIILDWTPNTNFWDSNIWFKSYFYVLNKVLADLNSDFSYIEWYDKDFISSIEKNENYLELYKYLKDIIKRNNLYTNAQKFEFLYVWNYEKFYLNTRSNGRTSLSQVRKSNFKNSKRIFFTDFVERIWKKEWQAYFDDRHITNFKIIATENWFNFVDVKFEEKIRKYFFEFKEKNIKFDVIVSKEKKGNEKKRKWFLDKLLNWIKGN